ETFKQFSNEVRKMTPTLISAKQPSAVGNSSKFASSSSSSELLDAKVEEYFLNLHSSSLKKCIYFLQDRVSANCIKRIKKECYPGWKAQHFPPLVASKLEPENCERAREQCRTYVRQYS